MSEKAAAARLRTEAFARVIGPFVAIFTAVIAIRLSDPALVAAMTKGLFAQPIIAWMLGGMMIGGGLVIIGLHRSWRGPAAVVISLLGWFIGLRGLMLIATTDQLRSAVDTTLLPPGLLLTARIFFALMALLGLWLGYVGWFSRPARS